MEYESIKVEEWLVELHYWTKEDEMQIRKYKVKEINGRRAAYCAAATLLKEIEGVIALIIWSAYSETSDSVFGMVFRPDEFYMLDGCEKWSKCVKV